MPVSTTFNMPLTAPKPKKMSRRFDLKRDAIHVTAAKLFNEKGLKGVTLSEIAASVGLETTSITYYYRKKEDLAVSCMLRAIAEIDGLVRKAALQTTVTERVEHFFTLYAGLLATIASGEQPPLIGFSDVRALPEATTSKVFTAYVDMFRGMRTLLSGVETVALNRQSLNARTHLMVSAMNWTGVWISRHETDEYPRIAKRVANILLYGLAGRSQTWPSVAALAEIEIVELALAPDDSPEAFLRAATELINEQGYHGASVDKISARINLTKGAFYHHNETKLDLVTACWERSFSVLRHTLKAAEQSGGTGWTRCCAAVSSLVRFQLSERGPLLRTSAITALPDHAHRGQVLHTLQALTERIASLLVDGLVDGSIRPHDSAICAQLLSTTINAAAELHRWVPGISLENATQLYTRPGLLGLLCEAED